MSKPQRTDFYAHSTDREDKVDWQSLAGHLSAVGELAAQKAAVFGGASLAQVEGLLHDLGKYKEEFQTRQQERGIGK